MHISITLLSIILQKETKQLHQPGTTLVNAILQTLTEHNGKEIIGITFKIQAIMNMFIQLVININKAPKHNE